MAQAQLNFDEAALDHSSDLYQLYDRLLQGMKKANEVDAPPFPSANDMLVVDENGNATFDSNGEPIFDVTKKADIEKTAADYAELMLKNSAYLFANSILSVLSGGSSSGDGSTTGFVSRGGDSMKGALQAWYGFEAGSAGIKIFDVNIDADSKKWAIVSGNLKVTEDAEFKGLLNFGKGIAFDGNKVIYSDNSHLVLENPNIDIKGDTIIDGTLTLGKVKIDSTGIQWDGHDFYHSGNSNKSDVDWTMKNANVFGDLIVKKDTTIDGSFSALGGFSLGALNDKLFYSEVVSVLDSTTGSPVDVAHVTLNSDFHIINGHGIKFDDSYIVNVRPNTGGNIVSFSAPNMVMNLGDSDNGKQTKKITIQADIFDYSGNFKLISKEGAGYFPNGLLVKTAVSSTLLSVLETYDKGSDDLGVLFRAKIRFGTTDGPAIYQSPTNGGLNTLLSYIHDGVTEKLGFNHYFAQTTSPFRDLSLPWSATLHFSTDGELFAFDKPAEAAFFAIKSEKYKTRLIEDALFFDDGKFIEGVVDGLRYAGNSYFDGSISSPGFASGFAGYGWAVKDEVMNGGFHATFDSLTVRKKMRIYELEVQKLSVTNGSLWVSDYCSGDEVIPL